MNILAIETSADETAAAVTNKRKVLSNVIYSQILLHKKWGGIYPSLAKRAHEERIDQIIDETLIKFTKVEVFHPEGGHARIMQNIDYIAVTQGPGLAIALEVGIRKAKELAEKYNKKIITVNHLEGHIYSSFVQNSKGNPKRDFKFPYLVLIVSGGHTEIVLFKNHMEFEVLGETLDDAAGEALDKAGKILGLGYPAGPAIERLSSQVENKDFYGFPRPMIKSGNLDFSFSGLKTSFYYFIQGHSGKREDEKSERIQNRFWTSQNDKKLTELASSFQEAIFETLLIKTEFAINKTGINKLVVGGGVIANLYLRKLLRDLVKKHKGEVYFPTYKYLTGDNAAMIGVAAYYKAQKKMFAPDLNFDRIPRLTL
ncbi:tRNA (adenosine(37)-N6)-threonylcarbamoyltransferase complex transferase subunit TsaD [Candidatus Roizmanbacteria bacterium RIFCSPHIGHO2_01_FULL_35_10]|uniref:tRNA N6-adenosine threonylcarbamoyltransferase n=1 Tax=Candidatus Roizmanbacteria bacterium RIFCSPLOWO2_01_FULL_35_13 TaxID=1802055 RepID=A0A1F7I7X1_9BACT|nr:MAG: tRNA (adenosine(37)-N6)-threonylcarbamoyltransferase complex transferase subunit TsaD [Candidatus Roizmanbacteria bacterium RIFCSPHIGHO2_01_FULL_35_10]OGK39461.1 MAG: tRNA (adenosine(37)-N6)-threonylcarbamoyltransferase complex transferase subunit TsaD [Candidatus Roizmanbacteria bacterium RIFCSPLOWO2_01_FULL_35_13]